MKDFLATLLILIMIQVYGQENTFSELTLLEYGNMLDNRYNNAHNLIANEWGIEFVTVGGCLITETLKDSADVHNQNAKKLLAIKYGDNWELKFNQKVEEEYAKIKAGYEILESEDFIISLKIRIDWVDFIFLQKVSDGEYMVSVVGYGDWNGSREVVSYYRLELDLTHSSTFIISDKIEMLD